jgi:DNA-3-methyladenine glycosylase I
MVKKLARKIRCLWVSDDPLYIHYHDQEWGVPIYDERLLFEFLILEGAQAGLRWITILKRREHYRQCFDYFDAQKIAAYDAAKIKKILENTGVIRNRLKIQAVVSNAQAYLKVKEEFSSFSDYLWQFVDGKPLVNCWQPHQKIPATTPLSDKLSKDLKKRGFKFVGSTICYAFMQAVGMVNDHLSTCFRHYEVQRKTK